MMDIEGALAVASIALFEHGVTSVALGALKVGVHPSTRRTPGQFAGLM